MRVRRWAILGYLALWCLATPGGADAQRAVLLVRHAERADESRDSPLSAAGEARAQALADLLAEVEVGAIYATPYRRTTQTARPLADRKGLAVEEIGGTAEVMVAATAARVREHGPEDVVLVVGHSNTVPLLLTALGHPEEVTIAEDEHDDLFVVVPDPDGPPVVLRLRYGAALTEGSPGLEGARVPRL